MALTNGAGHSDYQVRTWFVLFAPNPPSCRPDKEGRASPALSFPLIEDRRVLLIGTLDSSSDWGLKDSRENHHQWNYRERNIRSFEGLSRILFEMCQLDSWFASWNCFPVEFQPLCVRAWHDIWSRAAGALCSAVAVVVLFAIVSFSHLTEIFWNICQDFCCWWPHLIPELFSWTSR